MPRFNLDVTVSVHNLAPSLIDIATRAMEVFAREGYVSSPYISINAIGYLDDGGYVRVVPSFFEDEDDFWASFASEAFRAYVGYSPRKAVTYPGSWGYEAR